jgi:predicted amidophosphoribosyltransferase
MGGKCASCEKDLHLVEELITGYCTECVKTVKAPSTEKSEMGAKLKREAEDLENAGLNKQIASLVKQPRMVELMKRLKSLEEAVEWEDIRR